MRYSILTIHPQFFESFCREGLIGKALSEQKIAVDVVNIRDFSDPPHHRVDEKPYGGGPGMVMKPEPIVRALRDLKARSTVAPHVIVFSAKGKPFTQETAERLATLQHLTFICGRYEGVDERIAEHFADEELRIGDYVLMGGEVAAEVVIEATARLIPGVIGNPQSLATESFGRQLTTEYPQYTRPPVFEGYEVPRVLQEGNHKEISKWREAAQT